MAHTEEDRKAFNRTKYLAGYEAAVKKWLSINPSVRRLNSGDFYEIRNGEKIIVRVFQEVD